MKKNKKLSILLILIIMVVSIMLSGCMNEEKPDTEIAQTDYKEAVYNKVKEDTSVKDIVIEEDGEYINCQVTVNDNLESKHVTTVAEFYAKEIKKDNQDKIVSVQIIKNGSVIGGHSINN